jgi:hypothetical protein
MCVLKEGFIYLYEKRLSFSVAWNHTALDDHYQICLCVFFNELHSFTLVGLFLLTFHRGLIALGLFEGAFARKSSIWHGSERLHC